MHHDGMWPPGVCAFVDTPPLERGGVPPCASRSDGEPDRTQVVKAEGTMLTCVPKAHPDSDPSTTHPHSRLLSCAHLL